MNRIASFIKSIGVFTNFRLRFITENTFSGSICNIGGQKVFATHAKCAETVSAYICGAVYGIRYSNQVSELYVSYLWPPIPLPLYLYTLTVGEMESTLLSFSQLYSDCVPYHWLNSQNYQDKLHLRHVFWSPSFCVCCMHFASTYYTHKQHTQTITFQINGRNLV